MAKTKKLIYSEAFEEEQGLGLGDAVYLDGTDEAGDASLCPTCGDPLTWHEQACAPVAVVHEPEPAPRPTSEFAYDLGRIVQPVASVPGPVLWRGQLKEPHPETGLVQRTNVYYLGNGFWDCYREQELQAA